MALLQVVVGGTRDTSIPGSQVVARIASVPTCTRQTDGSSRSPPLARPSGLAAKSSSSVTGAPREPTRCRRSRGRSRRCRALRPVCYCPARSDTCTRPRAYQRYDRARLPRPALGSVAVVPVHFPVVRTDADDGLGHRHTAHRAHQLAEESIEILELHAVVAPLPPRTNPDTAQLVVAHVRFLSLLSRVDRRRPPPTHHPRRHRARHRERWVRIHKADLQEPRRRRWCLPQQPHGALCGARAPAEIFREAHRTAVLLVLLRLALAAARL